MLPTTDTCAEGDGFGLVKASAVIVFLSACAFLAAIRFLQRRRTAACGAQAQTHAQLAQTSLGDLMIEQLAGVSDETLAGKVDAWLHGARDGSQARVDSFQLHSEQFVDISIYATTGWLATLTGKLEQFLTGSWDCSTLADRVTLLHACSLNDSVGIAQLLLEAGVKPDSPGQNGLGPTPLHVCCSSGSVRVAKVLIDAGADTDAPLDLDWLPDVLVAGATPLHTCSCFNSAGVAKLLLDAGVDKDAKDDIDLTPLMVCSKTGSVDVAKLLIKARANIR